jgi:hypothetical protein
MTMGLPHQIAIVGAGLNSSRPISNFGHGGLSKCSLLWLDARITECASVVAG